MKKEVYNFLRCVFSKPLLPKDSCDHERDILSKNGKPTLLASSISDRVNYPVNASATT